MTCVYNKSRIIFAGLLNTFIINELPRPTLEKKANRLKIVKKWLSLRLLVAIATACYIQKFGFIKQVDKG